MHGALAGKRAAHTRALALPPAIRKLMAAGFVSQRGLANELNRRGILGAVGGRWHRTSVARMLTRLDLLMWSGAGPTVNWQASGSLTGELRPFAQQFVNFGKRALSPSRPSRAS